MVRRLLCATALNVAALGFHIVDVAFRTVWPGFPGDDPKEEEAVPFARFVLPEEGYWSDDVADILSIWWNWAYPAQDGQDKRIVGKHTAGVVWIREES